jgi:hypothetical protein
MRTTVDLDPEAYRIAQGLASQRHETLGKVLGDAIMDVSRPISSTPIVVRDGPFRLPMISLVRVITPEEVAETIEED